MGDVEDFFFGEENGPLEAYEINLFTTRYCVGVCRNASLAETGLPFKVNEEHSGLLALPTLIFRQHLGRSWVMHPHL